MKTVTITLHNTENCGSSFQAFALQHFLKEHGIENELIDYVPTYTQTGGHRMRTLAREVIYFRATMRRKRNFRNFIRKYLILSKKKHKTLEQLKHNPPVADCYITGSDQLWNTMYACGRDPAFYLDFANGKKVAYAVSMGEKIYQKITLTWYRNISGPFRLSL